MGVSTQCNVLLRHRVACSIHIPRPASQTNRQWRPIKPTWNLKCGTWPGLTRLYPASSTAKSGAWTTGNVPDNLVESNTLASQLLLSQEPEVKRVVSKTLITILYNLQGLSGSFRTPFARLIRSSAQHLVVGWVLEPLIHGESQAAGMLHPSHPKYLVSPYLGSNYQLRDYIPPNTSSARIWETLLRKTPRTFFLSTLIVLHMALQPGIGEFFVWFWMVMLRFNMFMHERNLDFF